MVFLGGRKLNFKCYLDQFQASKGETHVTRQAMWHLYKSSTIMSLSTVTFTGWSGRGGQCDRAAMLSYM